MCETLASFFSAPHTVLDVMTKTITLIQELQELKKHVKCSACNI